MKRKYLLIGIVAVLLIAAFFWPKARVIGGKKGFASPMYTEEFSCLGFAYDHCPDMPDYGCDKMCLGWTYNRQCYNSTFVNNELEKITVECG
ncbi:Uncharacterised protein [uncultured archaeon]|nr:Uncharacterised protein [uncultured archaeon]